SEVPGSIPKGGPPSGLALDCSVDTSAALQAWIDAKPDGSVLPFPAHACYRIDKTLLMRNRHGLTFEGNGVVLKAVSAGDREGGQLWFDGGSDIIVRDVENRETHAH